MVSIKALYKNMKTLKVFNIGIAVSVISIFCIAPASSYIEQPITAVHDNLSDSRYAQATREVQYSTCNLNSSWVRPSEVDQAAKLNSLSSFRGIDFTSSEYWENDIFLLRLYGASALNSVVHLSGLWTIQDGIFECYSFSFDLEGASLGEAPVVWLLGYQIVGLSWQENTYVMQVEPVQSGAQLVQFSRIGNLSQFPLRIENQESRESASLDAENYGIVTAQLSLDLLNSLYFCHAPTYEIRDVLANMEADYFQHNGRLSTDGIATFQRQIDAYNANPQRPFTFPSWIMRLLNGEQVLRSDVTTAVGTSGCYYENVAADSLDSDSIPEEVTCENGLNYVLDRPRIVQVNPNFESRSTIRTFNLRFCPERTQIDQSSLTTGKYSNYNLKCLLKLLMKYKLLKQQGCLIVEVAKLIVLLLHRLVF